MGKKLIGIAVIAVMLFGVLGLVACGNVSLDEYKVIKSQALQEYADAKGESNYCEIDWEDICKAVTDGKAAIEAAQTRFKVTKAFSEAKKAINSVENNGNSMDYIGVACDDMIELSTWFFTSGIANNMITFNYENAIFECTTDNGSFGYGVDAPKSVSLNSGESVHWQNLNSPTDIPHAYIDVIVKIDNSIVGYAVIEVYLKTNEPYSPTNDARVLEARLISKQNGQTEPVTYEQISNTIEKIKTQKGAK